MNTGQQLCIQDNVHIKTLSLNLGFGPAPCSAEVLRGKGSNSRRVHGGSGLATQD